MIRRPPRSTLFPTRRSSDLRGISVPDGLDWPHEIKYDGYRLRIERNGNRVRLITRRGYDWTKRFPRVVEAALRSEEHTSELQSHVNIVCRLLLEKKKNRQQT